MSPDPRSDHLKTLFTSALARLPECSGPRTVRLSIEDQEVVVRRPNLPGNATRERRLLAVLMGRLPDWKPVVRLSRTIDSAWLTELGRFLDLPAWRRAGLPLQICLACLAAKDLADQWDATLLCEVRPDRAGHRLWAAYDRWIADWEQTQRLIQNVREQVGREILRPPSKLSRPAVALQLEPDGQTIQVVHVDESEARVFVEPLRDLVDRAATPALCVFLEQADRLLSRLASHRAVADELLSQICPALAVPLKRSLADGQPVGYRMCCGQARGFPAEVLLFLAASDCSLGATGVHLVARRAHAEFVLENDGQPPEWFWFPAIQLQARLLFTGDRRVCAALPPEVRMPRMGPPFVHPYVGTIDEDRFHKVPVLNDDRKELMTALSDEAVRYFGPLLQPVSTARAKDMCLPRQGEHIRQLDESARRMADDGRRIDFAALVHGLWLLARQGLCRAHEENHDRPRVPLDADHMLYKIPDRAAAARGQLASRVFRYHQCGPTVLW